MDLSPDRKRVLLHKAEELAAELASGGATRSEWRHVIDALYLAPGEPGQRMETARELIEMLPESWLRGRSRKTKLQLTQVRTTFRQVQRARYSTEELRFLLGWTTRILDADEKERKREARLYPRGKWATRPPSTPAAKGAERPKPRPAKPERAPVPRAPQREVWQGATVSYNAGGGGILRAVAVDGRTAEARQEAARKLIEALDDEARARLVKKRRSLRNDVEVEKIGVSWRLVAVRDGA